MMEPAIEQPSVSGITVDRPNSTLSGTFINGIDSILDIIKNTFTFDNINRNENDPYSIGSLSALWKCTTGIMESLNSSYEKKLLKGILEHSDHIELHRMLRYLAGGQEIQIQKIIFINLFFNTTEFTTKNVSDRGMNFEFRVLKSAMLNDKQNNRLASTVNSNKAIIIKKKIKDKLCSQEYKQQASPHYVSASYYTNSLFVSAIQKITSSNRNEGLRNRLLECKQEIKKIKNESRNNRRDTFTNEQINNRITLDGQVLVINNKRNFISECVLDIVDRSVLEDTLTKNSSNTNTNISPAKSYSYTTAGYIGMQNLVERIPREFIISDTNMNSLSRGTIIHEVYSVENKDIAKSIRKNHPTFLKFVFKEH